MNEKNLNCWARHRNDIFIVSCGNDTSDSTTTATVGAFKSLSSITKDGTNLYIADTGSIRSG
jgi:hypothetical protein